jgi:hypothetical protein
MAWQGSSSAGDPTCTVHLKIWNAVSYLRHLKDAESPSASADPVAVTPIGASWMDTFLTGGEDLPSTPAQADASKAVHVRLALPFDACSSKLQCRGRLGTLEPAAKEFPAESAGRAAAILKRCVSCSQDLADDLMEKQHAMDVLQQQVQW